MQIYVIAGCIAACITALAVWENAKKRQALSDMRRYARRFTDPNGCPDAAEHYYDAIHKHNRFGILFDQIGYADARAFHDAAVASLELFGKVEQGENLRMNARLAALVTLPIEEKTGDVVQEIERLRAAIEASKRRLDRYQIDHAYLVEPHVSLRNARSTKARLLRAVRAGTY